MGGPPPWLLPLLPGADSDVVVVVVVVGVVGTASVVVVEVLVD